MGLRNRNGYKVSRNGLSTLLNNPFYIGVVRLKRTGETFQGAHHPLIRKSLFDQVQRILEDKTNTQVHRHNFLFRRLLSCARCEYSLIGERQKGHVYYRCHTKNCPTTGIREEPVEEQVLQKLTTLQFTGREKAYVQKRVARLREDWKQQCEVQIEGLSLNLDQTQDRLCRLTDAYLDGVIEKELFEERKKALLMERKSLEETLEDLVNGSRKVPDRLAEFLELAGSAYLKYKMGLPEEKRDLVRIVTSNRLLVDKSVVVKLAPPFSEVANRFQNSNGAPQRDIPRTWDRLIPILVKRLAKLPEPSFLGKNNPVAQV
ncbi:recombinase family protein [Acidobacteria bacterium AH-259-L09]|nr:recombinase family protein [Acidobacteria bacterium AH-259-L09]